MKAVKAFILLLALVPLSASILRGQAPPAGIPPEEYSERRERLLALLDTNSAAVLKASQFRIRSNDVEYRFRQESNFLYLTGMSSPNAFLMIVPRGVSLEGRTERIILFRPEKKLSTPPEGGLTTADVKTFNEVFRTILPATRTLYVSSGDMSFMVDWLNGKQLFLERNARKELEAQYPSLKVKNVAVLLGALREIKSPGELSIIRKAIELTGKGLARAMTGCRPGGWEYELQGDIEYEMTRGGAEYTAFPSIIGSGENSLILHYDDNRRQMKSGELVVMDVGAEYNGYAADITRTIPVSGKFSKAQSEVYSVVLRAQKEVMKLARPGIAFAELDKRANQVITEAGYGKYIRHGVYHPVGIDVHDVWGSDTLRVGMVLTDEPGIYIPADADSIAPEYRGFGIRIEDDILIIPNGCEVLTKSVPREISEIEKIMK